MFAVAAAMFAACSSDDSLAVDQAKTQQLEQGAVGFDAYVGRGVTRAGAAGDLDNVAIQEAWAPEADPPTYGGFGVFAYYTDNRDYDQLSIPNFMYNQKVVYESSAWKYEPLMYWPNEYGNNAISDDNDKVTFFAYAPYTQVEVASGKLPAAQITAGADKWGITSMTRNTASGDPIIKYIASFDNKKAVDLCWGVCDQTDWAKVADGQVQTSLKTGLPWLNVERPAGVDQKLKFNFKHATAKLQISVDEYNDATKLNGDVNGKTRIWIRSVRFTGFTMQGALNLNNDAANKPYWMNYNGIGDLVADGDVIVYDGRKDGKEAVPGAVATNEKVTGLNSQFIETESSFKYVDNTPTDWGSQKGVDATATNLFANTGSNPWFYVIPTGDEMSIEIVYDVETIDPNLGTTLADNKTAGNNIENRISKTIEFGNGITKLEPGKAYDVKLHLGMNSVKFDADVTAWEDMADPDIDLPANMPAYAAGTTLGTIDIPGDATEFVFAVTGLQGGEAVSAAATSLTGAAVSVNANSDFAAATAGRANASGVAYVKVTGITGINNLITDVATASITVTPTITTGTGTLTVRQKAQPLVFAAADVADKTYTLKVKRATDVDLNTVTTGITSAPTYTSPAAATDKIKVWRNGALLNITTADPSSEAQVKLDWENGTLTFNSAIAAGETVKVYLEAGDVPAATAVFSSAGALIPTVTP